ncbi:phosphoglycerate dehydrogenase [bacterium]|nr:phosphoglycerate dehydrogenase [bacterium]
MKTNIVITGALHERALAAFKSHGGGRGHAIHYHPDCARAELMTLVKDAHVLVTRSETDVDKEVIDAAPQLRVIARAAVGVGNIDIDYATTRGILVINCPGKNTNSAAELTLGLLLAMLRNIPQAQETIKKGGWDRHRFTGHEARGLRIGIVGLGNVGHRVAKFAHGLDMQVFAYDPYIAPHVFERHGAKPCASLRELAQNVDVLTVHVPLNQETKGMVNGEILDLMPRGGRVLNAARGGVIVEADLLKRLESGQIAGAGIDTWEKEPKPLAALAQHPRVWGTPHIGASTDEAQLAIGETIVEQVFKAIEGGVVDYPVNLPEVGVIDHALLRSYALLAEKIGALMGQLVDFNPSRVELGYRGDLAKLDHSLIRLSWLKGFVSHVVDDYVSFVNVTAHVEKLGLQVAEVEDSEARSYKSALRVTLTGAGGKSLMVGGIVFDESYLRISTLNDFQFETDPSGTLIMVENHDKPGVVGDVGHWLASKGINIDS